VGVLTVLQHELFCVDYFFHSDLKLDSVFLTYNMFSLDIFILIVTNDQRHTSWTASRFCYSFILLIHVI